MNPPPDTNTDRRFHPGTHFDTSFVPRLSISPPNSYQQISVSPPPLINNSVVYVPSPDLSQNNLVFNPADRYLGPPPNLTHLDSGGIPPMYSMHGLGSLSPTGPPTHVYPSGPQQQQPMSPTGMPGVTVSPQQVPSPTARSHHHQAVPLQHPTGVSTPSRGRQLQPMEYGSVAPTEQTRMFHALRALEVVQRCAFMLDEESKAYRSQYEMFSQLSMRPGSSEMEKCYSDMKQTLINLQYYYHEMKSNLQVRSELGLNSAEESIFTKFDSYFSQFEATQINLVRMGERYLRENSGMTPLYYPPHSRTQYATNLRREMQTQVASGSGSSHHSPHTGVPPAVGPPVAASSANATVAGGGPPANESQLSEQIQRMLVQLVAAQAHVEQQGARIKKQIEQALRCDTHKRFNDVSLFLYGACRQELLLRGGMIDFALHLPYPWQRKSTPPKAKAKKSATDADERSVSSRSRTDSLDSTSEYPPVPMRKAPIHWSASGSNDMKTMKNSPRTPQNRTPRTPQNTTPIDERKEIEIDDVNTETTKDVLDQILSGQDLGVFGDSVRKVVPPKTTTAPAATTPKKTAAQVVAESSARTRGSKSPPKARSPLKQPVHAPPRAEEFDPKDVDASTETTPSVEQNLQYDETIGVSDDMVTAIERCLHNFQIDSEFHRIYTDEDGGCVTFDDARSMFHVKIRPYSLAHMRSTRLVTTFVQIDTRVRRLIIVCKYWARERKLNDRVHGFSTFALCCMVIHYLQSTKPKVLPVLPVEQQSMNWETADCVALSGRFRRNIGANKQSDSDLLVGFFKYFGTDFHYNEHMVSIRLGNVMRKNFNKWAADHAFVIEDPFDIHRNVSAKMSENDLDLLKQELEHAYSLLVKTQHLTEICRVAG